MKAFTNHQFHELGDLTDGCEKVLTRQVNVLDWNGIDTCHVHVEGHVLSVPAKKLYRGREQVLLQQPMLMPTNSCTFIICHVCGLPASKLNHKGQGMCYAHTPSMLGHATNPAPNAKKVGRNDKCPCPDNKDLGLKFKQCCGKPIPNPVFNVKKSTGLKLGEEVVHEAEDC